MPITTITELYVFVLAGFVGYQVITRVPPLLHTPLMSATNAISAISLVGSLVVAGAHYNTVSTILGFIAVTSATINVVGGFLITDRMLKMFKTGASRPAAAPDASAAPTVAAGDGQTPPEGARGALTDGPDALHRGDVPRRVGPLHPRASQSHAPRPGAARDAAGRDRHGCWPSSARSSTTRSSTTGGSRPGWSSARCSDTRWAMWVPMTAMPQRIAISHMFGALAATLVGVAEYYTAAGTVEHRQDDSARIRDAVRIADRHRQLHGVRQAAGDRSRAADHVPRAERVQHRALRRDRRDLLYLIGHPANTTLFYTMLGLGLRHRRVDGAARSAAPTCRSWSRCSTRTRGWRRRPPASRSATTCSSSRARWMAPRASCSRS